MIQRIQQLPQGQRRIAFWGIMIVGILVLVLVTIWLIFGSINSQDDRDSVSLVTGITVKAYAKLPDDDSYPAAVVSKPDGTVLTGSYKTGVLWSLAADGTVTEIPGTRDGVGAVSGLAVTPDGTVYIVDQDDADPRTSGGSVKKLAPDGTLTPFAGIADGRGFVSPDDVTVDPAGNVYVSDRGRDEVWRFNPDGTGGIAWWKSPAITGAKEYAPTGLAYDAAHDSILITDSSNNIIYRVSLDGTKTDTVYAHGDRPNAPVFDGITATPDGTIYVAALSQDGIARVDGDDLAYIAGLFRGPSDVDYSPSANALYVTNFDSGALVVPGLTPRLPFTIDVVNLLKPA
ncbi:MAG: NHL repeat-containing protein [Chloroflexota bacterium]